jgi:polyphosphate glucokinase
VCKKCTTAVVRLLHKYETQASQETGAHSRVELRARVRLIEGVMAQNRLNEHDTMEERRSVARLRPRRILVIDVGGSKVKVLATGHSEPRRERSGRKLTPGRLVSLAVELAKGWDYEAVSLGYPGLVGDSGPRSEPGYLGPGWVGFDYAAAFGLPVRIVNDAAMQALGCYEGGRMLFLGLGTGLGSALIVDHVLVTLELGLVLGRGRRQLSGILGREGLDRLGTAAWRRAVGEIAPALMAAFVADYVVLGGGNAKKLDARALPPGVRLGHGLTAFRGGFRLWNLGDVRTLPPEGEPPDPAPSAVQWRIL